jgi:hypothetical protein
MSISILALSILSFAIGGQCQSLMNSNIDAQNTSIRSQKLHYTVRVGETLVIPCEIENRRQATVIWQYSKSRIPETLTVGYFYYRKDFRIRVIANTTTEREQSWNLEIRKVRLDDEGYYLCKVMAEPESLKRVVYLRVEVDLKLYPANPIVNMEQTFNLICNTSYTPLEVSFKTSKTTGQQQQSHHHQPKLVWFKDGEHLPSHLDHSGNSNNNSAGSNLSYKIEYHTKPFIWSIIHFKSISPGNIGTYMCKFRHQNLTSTLKYPNGNYFWL